jgi:hypothetical protein
MLSDSGAYYILKRDGEAARPDNPQSLLEDLYTRGFEVAGAWYRWGAPCSRDLHHSGGDTIYRGFFIIHLNRPDDAIVDLFKFERIPKLKRLDCPYYVREYFPVTQ